MMPNLEVLILQLLVTVGAARALGWCFGKIHQPAVLGEMVAGILLGPSLLGWVAPGASRYLFPPENMGALLALSQLGLMLFMFYVGLNVDPGALRKHGRTAVVTSNASVAVPFALGAALALWLYPVFAPPAVSRLGFVLFIAAAMSVTAFPVLARILEERSLLQTRLGALAIACAAVDDVTAWSLLAVVVVIVRSGAAQASLLLRFVGLAALVAVMLVLVRPAVRHMLQLSTGKRLAIALLFLLASAWMTEHLGVHLLFGAFLAGVVMPHDESFRREISQSFAPLSTALLLPLFFAYTGLRANFGVVHGVGMWMLCVLVIALAVVGKLAGSMIAARATGLPWRESAALGVLLNTRGLMELVLLNVGLDLGVISHEIFSIMVIMALVTTFMTAPLLHWLYPAARWKAEAA